MNKATYVRSAINLRPLSNHSQRTWRIGSSFCNSADVRDIHLPLNVRPDEHGNFGSLWSILRQLRTYSSPKQLAEISQLETYIGEICPNGEGSQGDTYGKLLSDSVAFAIMRRISRESIYTARVIDLSARTINDVLGRFPRGTCVHVESADRLDRPTLKVLARAALLLAPDQGFNWIWHFSSDPLVDESDSQNDLFLLSRKNFFRQLATILCPRIEVQSPVGPRARPGTRESSKSIHEISAALVLQNYDACFLWCDSLLNSPVNAEVVEGLRLLALAAVNVGRKDEALRCLGIAEEITGRTNRRAHLCYLQGLIEAKRHYDLSSSTAHYERGLACLDLANESDEDPALERAWLFNGLALNEVILWRQNPSRREHLNKAFELVRDAFSLVRTGDNAARTYLQFNLLSNSAFLLEMQGDYKLAVDVLGRAFDFGPCDLPAGKQRWRSTLAYRIGVLRYRAGELEQSRKLLEHSAEMDSVLNSWATQERILRALGSVLLRLCRPCDANKVFANGLQICRDARSVGGTREHARGLIVSLLRGGDKIKAREVYEMVLAEESLELIPGKEIAWDQVREEDIEPSFPSPKLPAYIPEVDLEDIPLVDLNRFLAHAEFKDVE